MSSRQIEVCLTPALINLYENLPDKIVVIIDILRATSTICTAFQKGAIKVITIGSIEEAMMLKNKGYLVAAERHGQKVEGFEIGNSPTQLFQMDLKDQCFAITTTNGTKAVEMTKNAYRITIGSFLNITALSVWLKNQQRDIILLCAGWKDQFNLEDTLFAGALISRLKSNFEISCDAGIASEKLYISAKDNLYDFLKGSSHFKRLSGFGVEDDIKFCLKHDLLLSVPVFNGEAFVLMS